MARDRIKTLLTELHRELAGTRSMDPESRRLLDQVLQDVADLGAVPGAAPDSATARLQEAALRVEAEHPRLAAMLGTLGDTLAKLGI
jgi:hypothetical protein